MLFRSPIYGEDCRKSIKINLLFSDVFEVKRHKNLDRYSKNDSAAYNELFSVPSTILNPFAQTQANERNE